MPMHVIRHIIWDWNGTLLDDVQACVAAINILLIQRNLPAISQEQYLNIFDFPVKNYYTKLGFDFIKDDWDEVAADYHNAYEVASRHSPLRHGAVPALTSLKTRGVSMSILSACELKILKRMINERHITGYFEHIYGLDNIHATSKVELGHTLFNNTGLDKQETLLIGDTTHDVEVARAMGIPCLLMSGGHQAIRKLKSLKCPMVCDFPGVLDFLSNTP